MFWCLVLKDDSSHALWSTSAYHCSTIESSLSNHNSGTFTTVERDNPGMDFGREIFDTFLCDRDGFDDSFRIC